MKVYRISRLIVAIMVVSGYYMEVQGQTLEEKLKAAGMVEVGTHDTSILVDLMYSKPDNFTGVVLYDSLQKAYLHPSAAKAIEKAGNILSKLHPGYKLLIKDASRPMSVQEKMYRVVQGTEKAPYVSNPKNGGGLHNYGLAVDITITDENSKEIPMGTPVDYLGKEANIDKEEQLVMKGMISETERQNRLLLRSVMMQAGFIPLKSEWWHFNLTSRNDAKARYKRLDF
ncbi:MAG: M15 family metallopeptidase [Muribaculum sp.]|nr:M15 family metallopeptidase [Muribaculum sp.]